MNAWKPIIFTLFLLGAVPLVSEGATTNRDLSSQRNLASTGESTPCVDPVGGMWAFGQAPRGCGLPESIQLNVIASRYGRLIFDETNSFSEERTSYTQNMFSFLREAADYYIDQRREYVSDEERVAWRRTVMAAAHQESYWSQYRISAKDEQLKFMRGDYGFGHGILQIDERWHSSMVNNARGVDLVTGTMYALDELFQAWERAPKASCVREGNFEDRARAAYAVYNGGPSKRCRWINPDDKWARNDKGFLEKFQAQSWMRYVSQPNAKSPVDIECIVEGGSEECGRGIGAEPTIHWVSFRDHPEEKDAFVKFALVAVLRTQSKKEYV